VRGGESVSIMVCKEGGLCWLVVELDKLQSKYGIG
jgi:hypothetical protein